MQLYNIYHAGCVAENSGSGTFILQKIKRSINK